MLTKSCSNICGTSTPSSETDCARMLPLPLEPPACATTWISWVPLNRLIRGLPHFSLRQRFEVNLRVASIAPGVDASCTWLTPFGNFTPPSLK